MAEQKWQGHFGDNRTPCISVYKHNKDAILPSRTNATDAGLDLYTSNNYIVEPGETVIVKTGVAISVPIGFVGLIWDRSGMASKGWRTGAGVVDHGYSGEIGVVLHNLSQEIKYICAGDKVAQMLIQRAETPIVIEVDQLWNSDRGANGFGSSDKT